MRTERSVPGVHMEVGVRQLREELSTWLDQVKAGDEIVITERGLPVARILPAHRSSSLERLIAEGRITPGRRPRPKLRMEDLIKPSGGPVSEFIKEQRR